MSQSHHSRRISFDGYDTALDMVQDGNDGVGSCIWDAALVLCHYVTRRIEFPDGYWKGKRCIELGAGTGVVGLTAAMLGANVTITDLQRYIPLITTNVERNKAICKQPVTILPYAWAENTDALSPPYDYILGSDLIYLPDTFPALARGMWELSGRNTVILLAYEKRKPTDVQCFQEFQKYFNYVKLDNSHLDENWQSDDIGIFRMTLKLNVDVYQPSQNKHTETITSTSASTSTSTSTTAASSTSVSASISPSSSASASTSTSTSTPTSTSTTTTTTTSSSIS